MCFSKLNYIYPWNYIRKRFKRFGIVNKRLTPKRNKRLFWFFKKVLYKFDYIATFTTNKSWSAQSRDFFRGYLRSTEIPAKLLKI